MNHVSGQRFTGHYKARFQNVQRSQSSLTGMAFSTISLAAKYLAAHIHETRVPENKYHDDIRDVEIPDVFYGVANGKGFDVICDDTYNRYVKEKLKKHAQLQENLAVAITDASVEFEVEKEAGVKVDTPQIFRQLKAKLKKRYNI